MRAILLRLLLPLAGLLAFELAFRMGAWNSMVAPNSHAGTTVRMRESVAAHAGDIDFVTLGSSRAEYGFDHRAIAKAAERLGYTHANLSMPGSHWMTVVTQTRWLRQERPEIESAVIGMSVQDMLWPENGNYELAIVQPLQPIASFDEEFDARFVAGDLATFGARSALFGYREDLRAFLLAPRQRISELEWFRTNGRHQLFDGPHVATDLCGLPLSSVRACAEFRSEVPQFITATAQCSAQLSQTGSPGDFQSYATGPLNEERQRLLELRQRQIRAFGWRRPPVLVLLPMTHLWARELMPSGADAWARRILQPLHDDGTITLIDLTTHFDRDGVTRCEYFLDIYHQNERGAQALNEVLLPQIEAALYRDRSAAAAGG